MREDEAMNKFTELELLNLINKTPALQSILYDIGMMPEQLDQETLAWRRMLAYPYLVKIVTDGFRPEIDSLQSEIDSLQAKIESLMLEYCPDKISAANRHD
mgnify:CR=1 FL=1